ncbi:hypothetical protein EHP00_1288 [Ecytonucleospora hepatopenaei]|uniref:Uncharacterized protein n=1 Tax=Ecytonucleospora hepatopenaei TaxID=646526 RepID=A0A1W0E6U7_9MICR|nr:hypothetical protein EHP00_1288 [Ecytonucleospora hepatopenaei]
MFCILYLCLSLIKTICSEEKCDLERVSVLTNTLAKNEHFYIFYDKVVFYSEKNKETLNICKNCLNLLHYYKLFVDKCKVYKIKNEETNKLFGKENLHFFGIENEKHKEDLTKNDNEMALKVIGNKINFKNTLILKLIVFNATFFTTEKKYIFYEITFFIDKSKENDKENNNNVKNTVKNIVLLKDEITFFDLIQKYSVINIKKEEMPYISQPNFKFNNGKKLGDTLEAVNKNIKNFYKEKIIFKTCKYKNYVEFNHEFKVEDLCKNLYDLGEIKEKYSFKETIIVITLLTIFWLIAIIFLLYTSFTK